MTDKFPGRSPDQFSGQSPDKSSDRPRPFASVDLRFKPTQKIMQISKNRQRPIAQKSSAHFTPSLEECLGPKKDRNMMKPKEIKSLLKSMPSETDQERTEGFFLGDNAEGTTDGEPEAKKKRNAFTEVKSFKIPIFKIANGIKGKVNPKILSITYDLYRINDAFE